jgi:hypothetical protein
VLCVDEKSQLQALARSQPAFPMMPGMPEKRSHDYVRHGVTSLFAAFNTADGTVISSLHRRHRTIEFKKFLAKIDSQVPAHLDVHLVCDNYGTHKTPAVKKWLATHPRFHMHYTPTYSSWINQVERWFAYLTDDLLRRGDHRSVQAVEAGGLVGERADGDQLVDGVQAAQEPADIHGHSRTTGVVTSSQKAATRGGRVVALRPAPWDRCPRVPRRPYGSMVR